MFSKWHMRNVIKIRIWWTLGGGYMIDIISLFICIIIVVFGLKPNDIETVGIVMLGISGFWFGCNYERNNLKRK